MLSDVFFRNVDNLDLLNDGVVTVNDKLDEASLRILKFELQTFVCEGHYRKGLDLILNSFLSSFDTNHIQQAVWISGFFGSGKSHLAKILRALWVNQEFPGGQRALDLVNLSDDVKDHFRNLSIAARKTGGLHAFSGTLKSGADDRVRLTTLKFLFASKGLPERLNQALFCLWLRDQGLLESIRGTIESQGKKWSSVVAAFMVSPELHQVLQAALPTVFPDLSRVGDRLESQFPERADVSIEEMVELFHRVLSNDDKLPLTLIVLDEVQQFIYGTREGLTDDIQEVVEALNNRFQSRILFVGTGQNALSGVTYLSKLMGRFKINVPLTENDTDTVVRENLLKKKVNMIPEVESLLAKHDGEIRRHLQDTMLSFQQHSDEDSKWLATDYPVLPTRRRFWDAALKSVDASGTASQLRNQLRMIYEAVRSTKDKPMGYVVPGDFIYEQNYVSLEQSAILPRELRAQIELLKAAADENERLKGRIISLVFLIGKVNEGKAIEVIPCTTRTLEDLLINDLNEANTLRQKVQGLCDQLVEKGMLQPTGKGYSVQTREGQKWTQQFKQYQAQLADQPNEVHQYLRDGLREFFGKQLGTLTVLHGSSKVPRNFSVTFAAAEPPKGEMVVWIRNGWDVEENSTLRDIKAVGPDSPWIVVYLPKRAEGDARSALIDMKAAEKTLNFMGTGIEAEGKQARESMLVQQNYASSRLATIWGEVVADARVWIGGGEEVATSLLVKEKILDAGKKVLARVYPSFSAADNPKWPDVLSDAQVGVGAALAKLPYAGEVKDQGVCAELLKRTKIPTLWSQLRADLDKAPYGWPRDAIDGALMVLLVNAMVSAKKPGSGKDLTFSEINRKDAGTLYIQSQTIVFSTTDKLVLKSLYQAVGITALAGQEFEKLEEFRTRVADLVAQSGGPAPLPPTLKPSWYDGLQDFAGLPFAKELVSRKPDLIDAIDQWNTLREKKDARLPNWNLLGSLLQRSSTVSRVEEVVVQVQAIESQRSLLSDPDPVPSLILRLTGLVRETLQVHWNKYQQAFDGAQRTLDGDGSWKKVSETDRSELLKKYQFAKVAEPRMANPAELLATLTALPLDVWDARIDQWQTKVSNLIHEAARKLMPAVKSVSIPKPQVPLTSASDLDVWLATVRVKVLRDLESGNPVLPQ